MAGPTRVVVVYHSRSGHTRVLAEAVVRGAAAVAGVESTLIAVEEVTQRWQDLATADAIVFGCPTFMGSASAEFKRFMDDSYKVWIGQGWRDKIAAGFTNSSAPSGDKLVTLTQLAVFAAQHSMVWVGLGLMPGYSVAPEAADELNRLGSHLGAMGQSHIGHGPSVTPPESDRRTAAHLGRRVAEAAVRWALGAVARPQSDADRDAPPRHAATSTWAFPSPSRAVLLPESPVRRVNLRELAARPGRFEHHLMVVARIGNAQLEIATASEPLYFAHGNISDEYTIALPTGDALVDGFPMRTFLTDATTLEDVGRINHRVGDLVLHPHGVLHWPGRLRPPYEPFEFAPGTRRTGYTLVFCASLPQAPGERPLGVSPGREADFKTYATAVNLPALLADTRRDPAGTLAVIGETQLRLLVSPERIAPPHGGYLLVLEAADATGHFAGDLVYIPAGAELPADGIVRALLLSSDSAQPEVPPRSWEETPPAPFAVFEEAAPGALPFQAGALRVEPGSSPALVRVFVGERGGAEVPRYWLARMLFRLALHGFRLGYIETYGGFFYDDTDGSFRLGVRGAGDSVFTATGIQAAVEGLYRAVAPPGYIERLA